MRTRRATTMSCLLVAAALLAGACTGDGDPAANADPGSGSTQQQDAPAPVLARPGAPAVVAAGTAPAQVAAAVSRSLFSSSPAVVVALATDPDAVSAGAERARALGIPMLLADGAAAGSPSPSGSPSPGGSPTGATPTSGTPGGPAAAGDPAAGEIARLKPGTVLALGAGLPERLGGTGAKVVTDAAQLPAVAKAQPLADTAVLLQVGPGAGTKALVAAAGATGSAAGATLVRVNGTDPRADAASVTALARAKPAHVVAAGSAFGTAATLAERVKVAGTGVQLPGGGQRMLPGKRLVAMYGHPGTASLGVLGEQPLAQAIARAKGLAAPYRPLSGSTPVVPTFELIATVAQGSPGSGDDYSYEAPVSLLKPWVDAAGKAGVYVVLDLQPGRANFLDQAKQYESLLTLPHVGLALDPEWRLRPDQVPLTQTGSAPASEINATYRWLADLTKRKTLPQKLFVIHQFRLDMIGSDEPLQHDRDEVELLIHMDGQGPTGTKDATWAAVVGAAPKGVPFGWKNFYDEDSPMLTPAQTMTRKPTPSMISYQ